MKYPSGRFRLEVTVWLDESTDFKCGRRSRPTRRLSVVILACVAALHATDQVFGQGAKVVPARAPNIDVRVTQPLKGRTASDRATRIAARQHLARQSAAADSLRGSLPNLEVNLHRYLGTPEIVGPRHGQGVLAASKGDRSSTLRSFLDAHADAYGIEPNAADLRVVSDYVNPAGNIGWVELEQYVNGIPVFQGTMRGAFTANGDLARTVGLLASVSDESALTTEPLVTAAAAIATAAESVGWTIDGQAWLVYFPLASDDLRLAWATTIVGDVDGYLTLVDAVDGSVLFRKNLASYQSQPITLHIYPSDSPAPLSPTTVLPGSGTQAPFVPRQSVTLVGNEAPNGFNNLGWLTDGLTSLHGNNVTAGLDLVSPDGIDFTVSAPSRDFTATYNPATDAPGHHTLPER